MPTFIAQLRESLQRMPEDKKVGEDADIKWYRGAEEIWVTTSNWMREDAAARFIEGAFRIEDNATLKRAMGNDWFEQYELVRTDPDV